MPIKRFYVLLVLTVLYKNSEAALCDVLESVAQNNVTAECMKQLYTVCNNGSLLWRMFDASSKYPTSGMAYANNRDLGNYDECIDIDYRGEIKGKYCGLSVAIVNIFLDPIPDPYKLDIQPKALADVPHVKYGNDKEAKADIVITDYYSVSTLSLCVPDKCTPKEVGTFFLWGNFPKIQDATLVNFVDSLPCMTKDSNTDLEWGDIFFITILAIIFALCIACTTYDFVIQKMDKKPKHPLFLAFSFITNGKKLLHTTSGANANQIQCLNGIRFISMMWIIAGHNFVAYEQFPLINYKDIRDWVNSMKLQYAASAPIAVDTFFFLSGFLLAFGYLKSAVKIPARRQAMGIPMMVLHRYLRLTPAVAMLYFTSITIFRTLGTGPMWGAMSHPLKRSCEDHWWAFFLYIQNYVNYDDMCLNHTWYLSADMQMFILAPIVLIPLAIAFKNKKEKAATIGLIVLIVICGVFPVGIRFADQNIKNVYDTHSRFIDYLIGVLLAVIMRTPKYQKFLFHKLANLAIWCFVLVVSVTWILYYHNIIRIYEHTSDTLFYGIYRPIWCLSLAWMVYSCYHGYGGVINWILSLSVFQVGARLSYCMYLLHAVVEMYYVGLIRTSYYWGDYMIFYLWCGHFIVTMILSAIWSLAFESPMIVIEKLIFGTGAKRTEKRVDEGKHNN